MLTKPLEAGRLDLAQLYEEMVAPSAWLSVVPVERAILKNAARLEAELRLELPDAIHVASALTASCDMLLSNDSRIKVPAGLRWSDSAEQEENGLGRPRLVEVGPADPRRTA